TPNGTAAQEEPVTKLQAGVIVTLPSGEEERRTGGGVSFRHTPSPHRIAERQGTLLDVRGETCRVRTQDGNEVDADWSAVEVVRPKKSDKVRQNTGFI